MSRDLDRVVSVRALCAFVSVNAAIPFIADCRSQTLSLDSTRPAIAAIVHWDVDVDAGIHGTLDEYLSTALQVAPWQSTFFDAHPEESRPDASALVTLGPRHVLVQVYDSPRSLDSSGAERWDFSELDRIVKPLQGLGQEVVLQIYPPAWLDSVEGSAAGQFADYCAKLVSYYNTDIGIPLDGGTSLRSNGRPITYWAIWSDPNTNRFDPSTTPNAAGRFSSFYNAAVRAMQAIDPNVRFAGPEFNDCIDQESLGTGSASCMPGAFIPAFLAATANAGADGGRLPIDVLSLHMFSTDLAIDPAFAREAGVPIESDSLAFGTVGRFVQDVIRVRGWLVEAGRPGAPIWVTENQVNSDTPGVDGTSQRAAGPYPTLHAGFQADSRGTSAFFTAWRPYVFSQLGKAGVQELYQWQYTAGRCPSGDAGCSLLDASDTDPQNAEVNYVTNAKYLSYWVDQTLSRKFLPGASILKVDVLTPSREYSGVDVLATKRTEGGRDVVVVMLANVAVANTSDYNGKGAPREIIVDVTRLMNEAGGTPASWSASELTIDGTSAGGEPSEVAGLPLNMFQNAWSLPPISFAGYGVVFVTLSRPAGG